MVLIRLLRDEDDGTLQPGDISRETSPSGSFYDSRSNPKSPFVLEPETETSEVEAATKSEPYSSKVKRFLADLRYSSYPLRQW